MLSSLDPLGRTGCTAISDSAAGAEALYRQVETTLLGAAQAAAGATVRRRSAAWATPRLAATH